jgi:hypothetical protein
MAVVQISKIQLRRGKEQIDGIPQLAGGEMAWAIDTQKLYIGNGSVSEGAPAVGNTRILTQTDNLLDYADYVYRDNDPNIQTTANANFPIERTLQERLDERVSVASYGVLPDGTDQTANIQRAIDNLYLSYSTQFVPDYRVVLEFPPGTYFIHSTIYVPSYVTIVGAGVRKTIFQFVGSSTNVFEFISDLSTSTNRITELAGSDTDRYTQQPKYIFMSNFTVNTGAVDVQGLKLNSVRDSVFEDLEFTGGFGDSSASSANGVAIGMYALSTAVTTQRNKFNRISMDGFTYGIFAKEDVTDNSFTECQFIRNRWGVSFGASDGNGTSPANGSGIGQIYGPRYNKISHCYFEDIEQEGVIVHVGYGNKIQANTFIGVGKDGANLFPDTYHNKVKFISVGNSELQNTFDSRSLVSNDLSSAFKADVGGNTQIENTETFTVDITTNLGSPLPKFRLPISTNTGGGNPDYGYEISYVIRSNNYDQVRRGKISIAIDASTTGVQLSDNYEFVGTSSAAENIQFSATIISGAIELRFINTNIGDVSKMIFTYKALSYLP